MCQDFLHACIHSFIGIPLWARRRHRRVLDARHRYIYQADTILRERINIYYGLSTTWRVPADYGWRKGSKTASKRRLMSRLCIRPRSRKNTDAPSLQDQTKGKKENLTPKP